MRTPGFGAENALYKSSQRYALNGGMFGNQPGSGAVIMAVPIGGGVAIRTGMPGRLHRHLHRCGQ